MSARYYIINPLPLESFLEKITSIGLEVDYRENDNIHIFDPVHKDGVWICGSDDGLVDSLMRFYPNDGHIMMVLEKELGFRSISEYVLCDYLNTRVGPRDRDFCKTGNGAYLDVIDDQDELGLEELWDSIYGDGVEERIHCPIKFVKKGGQA